MIGLGSLTGENNTKEKIVSLLSREWPLTAKRIYNSLRHDTPISYQATHKTLQELLSKGVLSKNSAQYLLNLEWIKALKRETNTIEMKYLSTEDISSQNTSGVKLFSSLHSLQDFLIDLALHQETGTVFSYSKHLYPFFVSTQYYKKFKALSQKKPCHYYSSNTSLDKWIEMHYNEAGSNALHTSTKTEGQLFLTDKTFAQAFLPKALTTLLDKHYSKPLNKTDLSKLIEETFYKETEIILFYNDNPCATRKLLEKDFPFNQALQKHAL